MWKASGQLKAKLNLAAAIPFEKAHVSPLRAGGSR